MPSQRTLRPKVVWSVMYCPARDRDMRGDGECGRATLRPLTYTTRERRGREDRNRESEIRRSNGVKWGQMSIPIEQ